LDTTRIGRCCATSALSHGRAQTIALVGHTGSGKTSIINLLVKFYLPNSGRVLVDGRNLQRLQTKSLHRQFGLVLQQNFLFMGTVADNMRFAKPEATPEELREVCRRLDCLDRIESLPQGFDTDVTDRGGHLPLGQRQMVCFARALLADPKLLILDEATSSIDPQTEQRLQRALAVLLADRTSFVVAHRLSTIRHADLVLVLDHGHIVEHGTPMNSSKPPAPMPASTNASPAQDESALSSVARHRCLSTV